MTWLCRLSLTLVAVLGLVGPALAQSTLRVVMHSDLKIVDPIWTTAYISRNHGYMIYDTLFAMDEKFEPKPQMVESWTVSDDKLIYTFTLREGLTFHDGPPVTAEDAVASIERWAARDTMGLRMAKYVKSMRRRGRAHLHDRAQQALRLVLLSLGKPSSNVPFIMPKRVAETSPTEQITDYTGSGPVRLQERRVAARGDRGLREIPGLQAPCRGALLGLGRQGGQGRPGRVGDRSPTSRPR